MKINADHIDTPAHHNLNNQQLKLISMNYFFKVRHQHIIT
ncbi:hypothetical protein BSPWISOX_3010 [uncultured Gammaproteobacteria bacterium]|nr:hypothetical protein BSPWISOX_3010 [uncultured Gammaproteobacteria bacterium]